MSSAVALRRGRLTPFLIAFLATATIAVVSADPASAADCTKFAARTGSDSNSGTAASPFKSAQKLVDSLSAGQTGCLRAGAYTETNSSGYVVRFPRAGSSGAPITLRSYPGERARLVGIVEVPNGSDNVSLTDVDVEGTGSANTVKVYAADVVIARNDITNVNRGRSCMMLGNTSGGGQAVRTRVEGNVFHECGSPANGNLDHGIYASNIVDGQIVNNVMKTPAAYSIQLYPHAQSTRVAHNVIDGGGSTRGGIVFGGDSSYASTNNVVEQNVITYPATYAITSTWGGTVGTGNVARSNCVWGTGSTLINTAKGFTTSGNLTGDPWFFARPLDYRLGALTACLPLVGYDTAAMLSDGTTPTPTPTPSPSPTPTPTPSPTPTPNAAPTVSWQVPLTGATVAGTLSASNCAVAASDDTGIQRVEFFVDGKALNVDTVAPYGCALDTKTVADGTHTLRAVAYDGAGASASASVQVTVANGAGNQPPVVTLNKPADGSSFTKYIEFDASASDDGKVAKVEFYVDGKLSATETGAPYHQFWNGGALTYGTHQVFAKAYDKTGLTTSTAPVTITRVR